MFQLPFYGYIVGFLHSFLLHSTVGLPEQALWVSGGVIFILGAAATVDAFTEVVPDFLIFLGLLAVTGTQGLYVSWPFASHHLMIAIAAGLIASTINELCYKTLGSHIFCAGDIKWTILAVSCFDAVPVLYAWGFGSICGIIRAAIMRSLGRPFTSNYLSPFLFLGLLGALYGLRVNIESKDILLNTLKTWFL